MSRWILVAATRNHQSILICLQPYNLNRLRGETRCKLMIQYAFLNKSTPRVSRVELIHARPSAVCCHSSRIRVTFPWRSSKTINCRRSDTRVRVWSMTAKSPSDRETNSGCFMITISMSIIMVADMWAKMASRLPRFEGIPSLFPSSGGGSSAMPFPKEPSHIYNPGFEIESGRTVFLSTLRALVGLYNGRSEGGGTMGWVRCSLEDHRF